MIEQTMQKIDAEDVGVKEYMFGSYPTMGLSSVPWVSLHEDTLQCGSWGRHHLGWRRDDSPMCGAHIYCNYLNFFFFLQPFSDIFHKNYSCWDNIWEKVESHVPLYMLMTPLFSSDCIRMSCSSTNEFNLFEFIKCIEN